MANAIDEFGRLYIAVTNAGIVAHGPFATMGADEIKAMLDVPTLGHLGGAIRRLEALRQATVRPGRIHQFQRGPVRHPRGVGLLHRPSATA